MKMILIKKIVTVRSCLGILKIRIIVAGKMIQLFRKSILKKYVILMALTELLVTFHTWRKINKNSHASKRESSIVSTLTPLIGNMLPLNRYDLSDRIVF
jgi:hypothetical protein